MHSATLPTLLASLVFATANAGGAQSTIFRAPQSPSRFTLGASLVMSQPEGEFASNIGRGWGGDFTGLFRLDEKGFVQLRADAGILQYGREVKNVPLDPITGRVSLKVTTSNMIGWGSFGGQLQIPTGAVRPYVNLAIAYTDFLTRSTLSGLDDSSEGISSSNQHDGSHAWVSGAGVDIPFGRSFLQGGLTIGARYFHGGEAAYLKKGDIVDNPDGSISFTPRRSRTDMVLWQLGASFTLPR